MQVLSKYLKTKFSVIMAIIVCSFATVSASGMIGDVSDCYFLNVRNGAGVENQAVNQLKRGDRVQILEENNGWLKIDYNGNVGWVNKKYIQIQNNDSNSNQAANAANPITTIPDKNLYVNVDVLNVRTGGSLVHNVLTTVIRGEVLTAFETNGEWFHVRRGDGLTGWVCGNYLSEKQVSMTNSSVMSSYDGSANSGNGQNIVDNAMKYVGSPYSWGGSSPSGFDCSGFVGYIYKNFAGIELNRTASDMSNQGTTVSKDNVRPGDLMFFYTGGSSSSINHVGIYMGGGKMIHASSSKNQVITTSIDSDFWRNAFRRVQRMMN